MADKKISQLTELTSANAATDFLPVVDTSAVETKKITLANLPLSDAAKDSAYPYTTDFQSGVEQTRNLTTIDSSSGFSYTDQPSSIYIGSNVTSIGDFAFTFGILTSIIIPDSVTSIGTQALEYCGQLTSAIIGNGVTSIGSYAFLGCNSLTSVAIGNSVTSIANYTFNSCSSLTSITIPDSVTSIGSQAFYQCTSLTSVIIPDSVTSIGSFAFYYCTSLTSVNIPNGVTSIANYTFNSCTSLISIIIPDSVTSIGNFGFESCASLATINCLATTAPTLGNNAFDYVATSDIHVPVGAAYPATYGGLTVVFDL